MTAPAFAATVVLLVAAAWLTFAHFNSRVIIALVALWIGGAIGFFVFALLSIGKNGDVR